MTPREQFRARSSFAPCDVQESPPPTLATSVGLWIIEVGAGGFMVRLGGAAVVAAAAVLVTIGSHGVVAQPKSTIGGSDEEAPVWYSGGGGHYIAHGFVSVAAVSDETSRRAVADAARCAWLLNDDHSRSWGPLGWMVELEPWMGAGDRRFELKPTYTYADDRPLPDPEVIFYSDLGSCPTGAQTTGMFATSGSEGGLIPYGSTHALVLLTMSQRVAYVTIDRPKFYPCFLMVVCVESGVQIRSAVSGGSLWLHVFRT